MENKSKVEMIPYRATHVPTYHLWMQDKQLQVKLEGYGNKDIVMRGGSKFCFDQSWGFMLTGRPPPG